MSVLDLSVLHMLHARDMTFEDMYRLVEMRTLQRRASHCGDTCRARTGDPAGDARMTVVITRTDVGLRRSCRVSRAI
jgi:hypothetical protein